MPHTPRHNEFDDPDFEPGSRGESGGGNVPVKTGTGTIGASETGHTGSIQKDEA